MNLLRKLFARPEPKSQPDMVLLRMVGNRYLLTPVEWFCDVPFAAPYLPETRCELLPGGKVIGDIYIDGWRPATPRMDAFFAKATNTAETP